MYELRQLLIGGVTLVATACTTPDTLDNTSAASFATQGNDRCGFSAGTQVASHQHVAARSNGSSTGTSDGSLSYQCVAYAKSLAGNALRDSLAWAWGTAAHGLRDLYEGKAALGGRDGYFRLGPAVSPDGAIVLDDLTPTSGYFVGEPPREDDLLILWPRDTGRAGTVYDDRPISGEMTGHVAAVAQVDRDANGRVTGLDLIEQNVVTAIQCQADGWASRHVAVTYDNVYGYRVSPGSGMGDMIVAGWIRHDLAGVYADGWHDDASSDAFRAAYDRAGKYIGWGCENGGGPFVHAWLGMLVQDVCPPCALEDKAACGGSESLLVAGPPTTDARQVAYRVAWGFRGYFLSHPEALHRPLSDEIALSNGRTCQVFELGYLLWTGLSVVQTGNRPDAACTPQAQYARSATTQLPTDIPDEGVGGGTGGGSTTTPPATVSADRTIACDDSGSDLVVTVTGPLSDSLIGGPPVQSTLVTLVGDRSYWVPGAGISTVPLQPDFDSGGHPVHYTIHAPLDLGSFNVYVFGGSEVKWGDLPDVDNNSMHFTVTGACAMVCDGNGCAARRVSSTQATARIDCELISSTVRVTVRGPIGASLVGGNGTNPSSITWGGDVAPGWTDDTGKTGAAWTDDLGPYVIDVPSPPGRFNLKVHTADGTRWADLPDADGNGSAFAVGGACHVTCSADGCALATE